MNCIVCKERGDVVVHVENEDPLIYCDGCRVEDKPEARFRIVSELRLTRKPGSVAGEKQAATIFDVACGLTSAACLSIRDEDLVGVEQSVLDAVSRILEENRKLREENRRAVILVQGHGRELRKSQVDAVQHIDTSGVHLDRGGPEGFMNWLLIHAIAHHAPKDPELKAVWDRLRLDDIPVEFKIAGANVPFAKVVYAINGQLDRMIEEKALELFKARCEGVIEALDMFREGVRSKAHELFPLVDRDDRD